MRCMVSDCNNDSKKIDPKKRDTKLSYFSFPDDSDLRAKWLQFCGIKNKFNPKTFKVCSEHFNPEDIEGHRQFEMGLGTKRFLRNGAIPCIRKMTKKELKAKLRLERENNKKIVESLLEESERAVLEEPNIALEAVEFLDVQKDVKSDPLWPEPPIPVETITWEYEMYLLKRENEKLQKLLEKSKHALREQTRGLKRTLQKAIHEKDNLEQKLRGIFTDGQICKLKNGLRKQYWTKCDIINSLALYNVSSKAYKFLKSKNFPFPSVRTLQQWVKTHKSAINVTTVEESEKPKEEIILVKNEI